MSNTASSKQKWRKYHALCGIYLYKLKWKIENIYHETCGYRESKLLCFLFLYFLYYIWGYLLLLYWDSVILELPILKQLELYSLNKKIISPTMNIDEMKSLSYLETNSDILIAGMVRNAENTLPDLLKQIQIFACSFHYVHIIIFESNSDDSTPLILNNWLKSFNDSNSSYIKSINKICNDYKSNKENKEIHITLLQPQYELQSVRKLYQNYRRGKIKRFKNGATSNLNKEDIRIGKYIEYRNWMLHYIQQFTLSNHINIDHLIWIDADLVGFDYLILTEFMHILKYKNKSNDLNEKYYHVICGNSIKYNGWYYDTYSTIFANITGNDWAYFQYHRSEISNIINSQRFVTMKSCFGGVAIYDYKFLIQSKCKYMHIVDALNELQSLKEWLTDYHLELHEICEHIAMNMCLREHGANIAISSRSNVYYGTDSNKHGTKESDYD